MRTNQSGGLVAMQTKTNLARVNGIELGYQEFGKGKPLILLHGGFGSLEMFGPNIDLLAKGRKVIGGGLALRTAIQHPEVVERLVLLSTVFKRDGWHPEMRAGMDAMGPQTAQFLMQTPMYEAYKNVAPNVN